MVTFFERARGLSSQIRSLAGSQVTEREAKAFETRAQELSEAASLVFFPARLTQLFMANEITGEGADADARMLKRSIDSMMAKYSGEPASILEADPQWRLLTKSQFAKLAERTTVRLQEAWCAFVLAQKPVIDQGRRNIWKIVPAHQEQALLVEQRLAEFDNIAQHLPTSLEDLDRPEQLAAELDEIVRDLPTDLPEPVRELFQAITQGTATAEHLTDEAVEWLREKQLLNTLRVMWRAT